MSKVESLRIQIQVNINESLFCASVRVILYHFLNLGSFLLMIFELNIVISDTGVLSHSSQNQECWHETPI